jgi:hypothetical protein
MITNKLYDEGIKIMIVPSGRFRNKWKAESAYFNTPYEYWGTGGKQIICYGRTPAQAIERVKDKLCKVTANQEARHDRHLEWKSRIKEMTFNLDQDCCSVKSRPKLFHSGT